MADPAAASPPAPSAPVTWTPPVGLSSAQVAERRSRGLTNAAGEHASRSVADILRANIFTRFNLLLGVLLAVILVWGDPRDALFGIVLVSNALIGIAQELRAKRTLDRLAVLSAPRVRVIRDGAPREIAVEELVADDLVDLRAGDQMVADGVVRDSASLQADESLLTGESEPVDKRAGDRLLSGSFVVAGSGGYQATGVGAEAYARKLAAQARRFTLVRSGAAATKAVAELVLLDNRFATLPGVVAEGRRVTANIERVANLFIIKTVWATLLAIATGVTLIPYPFLPRHLTIIDSLAIGVPAFFLAHLLRARAAARRAPGRLADRRTGSRRARRILGPLPSARPRIGRDDPRVTRIGQGMHTDRRPSHASRHTRLCGPGRCGAISWRLRL